MILNILHRLHRQILTKSSYKFVCATASISSSFVGKREGLNRYPPLRMPGEVTLDSFRVLRLLLFLMNYAKNNIKHPLLSIICFALFAIQVVLPDSNISMSNI